MNFFIAFSLGYATAWLVHGGLLKRIRNTYYYITKSRYSLPLAWHLSGRTL